MSDGRDNAGRFAAGNAGGPGRKPGFRVRKSFAALLGDDSIEKIAKKVKSLAEEGDPVGLKIACERLWPALNRSELSGIDGEAIQLEAPDWKSWSSDELAELKATATRIAAARKAKATATNGHSEPPVQH